VSPLHVAPTPCPVAGAAALGWECSCDAVPVALPPGVAIDAGASAGVVVLGVPWEVGAHAAAMSAMQHGIDLVSKTTPWRDCRWYAPSRSRIPFASRSSPRVWWMGSLRPWRPACKHRASDRVGTQDARALGRGHDPRVHRRPGAFSDRRRHFRPTLSAFATDRRERFSTTTACRIVATFFHLEHLPIEAPCFGFGGPRFRPAGGVVSRRRVHGPMVVNVDIHCG